MTTLPPWQEWCDKYEDHTMPNLELALDREVIKSLTVGKGSRGYSVSVRRDTDGFETFYGHDLAETIARAVMDGPQMPVKKVEPLAPWQEGVAYAFNSEGIEPL